MNWGKSIVVSFILFAGFIATLVTVCVREDISLVSKDYYNEELVYQNQIVRMQNTNALDKRPAIKVLNPTTIQVDFNQFNEVEKGELKLFRPSDSTMDRKFELRSSDTSVQLFPIDVLHKGMYRARMQWTMNGKEFFIEQVIYI
jgi:hypothetical protein